MHLAPKSRLVLGSLALIAVAAACDSATEPVFEGAPPLPPLQSLYADVSFFEDEIANGSGQGTHFLAAVSGMMDARNSFSGSLEFPIAILDGANTITPDDAGGTYHWRFVTTVDDQTFDTDLSGRARGVVDGVWEMRVTSATTSPQLNQFLWATGTAELENVFGEWLIFDPSTPAVRTQFLRVSWQRTVESYRAVFTNTRVGDARNGEKVDYESASVIRRIIHLGNSSPPNTISQILWNTSTNEGHILSPSYNGGQQACWDSLLQNQACTQ
jgi:hypothetical protein